MSTENEEEFVLVHEQTLETLNVEFKELPRSVQERISRINELCDRYETEATDEAFDEIQSLSNAISDEIKAYAENKGTPAPIETPAPTPTPSPDPQPAPTPAPKQKERNPWGIGGITDGSLGNDDDDEN